MGAKTWMKRAAGLSLAGIAAAIGYGRFLTPQRLRLPHAVPGERRVFVGRAGRISYYVVGSGAPLLLVHSINAAASAYEVAPLVEAFRKDRRVYAVDLPGFGFSDRSRRRYDRALYVRAIEDMLDEIADETGDGPVDIAALSLSSEFVARIAVASPARIRTLCLVTPTGFDRASSNRRGPPGGTREVAALSAIFDQPLWNRGLYNLLVTRPSIRFFLEKTWGSKRIDEGSFDYSYLTAHQPGAENAPLAFVSGRLFSADIREIYGRIMQPVLVLHGTRGDFADFSGIAWVRERPNWQVVAMDAGALVHFERPDAVAARYRAFLATPAG